MAMSTYTGQQRSEANNMRKLHEVLKEYNELLGKRWQFKLFEDGSWRLEHALSCGEHGTSSQCPIEVLEAEIEKLKPKVAERWVVWYTARDTGLLYFTTLRDEPDPDGDVWGDGRFVKAQKVTCEVPSGNHTHDATSAR